MSLLKRLNRIKINISLQWSVNPNTHWFSLSVTILDKVRWIPETLGIKRRYSLDIHCQAQCTCTHSHTLVAFYLRSCVPPPSSLLSYSVCLPLLELHITSLLLPYEMPVISILSAHPDLSLEPLSHGNHSLLPRMVHMDNLKIALLLLWIQ